MPDLSIYLLGPPRFVHQGTAIDAFRSDKERALLAYLAVEARPHRREALAALFWPESSQQAADNNLRQSLFRLRRALGGAAAALSTGKIIQINRSGNFWLDVTAFETLMTACESHPHRRRAACRACLERLEQAVELYSGDFLHEFFVPDCPAFEEWALFKRETLRRQALDALHTLAVWRERLGEWAPAERYARRQLALEPWRELAHQQLMRLLAANGERTAALTQYETCRRILSQELAVEPGAETTALYEAIRDETGPSPLPLPPSPHNLPAPLSSFVGRERELAEVADRLENPICRLLTLTGSGGVGKSRLALQAAARARQTFPDGAWLIELASVSEAALVPRVIAAALGAHEEPGFPLAETLAGTLRDKTLALILDNCEHLLEACAQAAGTLLQRCPSLVILATSREPLGIAGEMVYRVRPFSLPERPAALPAEALMGNEAVRLFAERAGADFDLTEANALVTTELCKRLDGVPLAIELAAARAGVLPPEQMLDRLGDRFALLTGGSRAALPRHRALRALVDWSYDLLSEAEQVLFRRLSVFRGGWTLEAAEAVADDPASALDLLARLTDKSLVTAERHMEQRRYHLLETIRDYASVKLVEAGEADAARGRHCAFYLRLAQSAERNQHGPDEAAWFRRLDADHDNLRAALDWSSNTDEEGAEPAMLRLASALWWFWTVRNYWTEGREWLERAIGLPGGCTVARAQALYQAGGMAYFHEDLDRAADRMQASVGCFRETGDPESAGLPLCLLGYIRALQHDLERAEASLAGGLTLFRRAAAVNKWELSFALYFYGVATALQEDYARAGPLLEESLSLRRELGDSWGMADTLRQLANVAGAQGNYARATELAEESLSLFRAAADRRGMGWALNILGSLALKQGDTARARAAYDQSLLLGQEIGRRSHIALSLSGLAAVAAMEGQMETAARLLGAVEANRAAMRLPMASAARADHERLLSKIRAALGDDAFDAARAGGQVLSLDQAAAEAHDQGPFSRA